MGNYTSQHKKEKDNDNSKFFSNFLTIFLLCLVVLIIGVLGFYIFNNQNWIDSFYNASTTMATVGATITPYNDEGKIFAACYSLFTGLFFVYILAFFIGSWLTSQ